MIMFSPFNPIHFSAGGAIDGGMNGYAHMFSTDDHIITQIFHGSGDTPPALELVDHKTGMTMLLNWHTYLINKDESVSLYEIRGIEPGDYRLKVGGFISNPIHVTDDERELEDTVLLQYSMRTNAARKDIYPILNGLPRYFELRLPGGFKDEGWSFSVDNEQYLTDKADIVELNAVEATDKVLTIGDSEGEPSWTGAKIGIILACDLLFVDGRRYSKSDDASVEIIDGDVDGTKFVYAVTLRQARYENPAFERIIRAKLRKVPSHLRKANRHLRRI